MANGLAKGLLVAAIGVCPFISFNRSVDPEWRNYTPAVRSALFLILIQLSGRRDVLFGPSAGRKVPGTCNWRLPDRMERNAGREMMLAAGRMLPVSCANKSRSLTDKSESSLFCRVSATNPACTDPKVRSSDENLRDPRWGCEDTCCAHPAEWQALEINDAHSKIFCASIDIGFAAFHELRTRADLFNLVARHGDRSHWCGRRQR